MRWSSTGSRTSAADPGLALVKLVELGVCGKGVDEVDGLGGVDVADVSEPSAC